MQATALCKLIGFKLFIASLKLLSPNPGMMSPFLEALNLNQPSLSIGIDFRLVAAAQ